MVSPFKSHVVLSGSIEHALLKSVSVERSRTRQQLLVIAIEGGLTRYDDQTVLTALRRLTATGLLKSQRGHGNLQYYCLTPAGQQRLSALQTDRS